MKVKLVEEDCRPRAYWFENCETGQTSSCFNMGSIEKQVDFVESFGVEVINKDEFID